MNKALANVIAEAVDGDIYENYSGRGMYGNTTTGVTFDGRPEDLCAALVNISGEIEELKKDGELDDEVGSLHFDSLGMDTIVY